MCSRGGATVNIVAYSVNVCLKFHSIEGVIVHDDASSIIHHIQMLFMVALCNRADHYIFILFLSSSFFFFFARLISAVGNWMFTILWHMMWP